MKMKIMLFVISFAVFFGLATTPSYASSFSDNFNDGNADSWWLGYSHHTPWVNGNWRVEEGKLVQDQPGDDFIALVEGYQLSDQIIETQLHTNGPSGYGGVTIWYQDSDHYTEVFVYPAAQLLIVYERTGESTSLGATFTNTNVSSCDTLCTLKVDANSTTGNLNVYINDVYQLSHQALTSISNGQSGLINGNAGGYFDNFSITSGSIVDPLVDKEQCKNDGWKLFTSPIFKNQGACVNYLQSNSNSSKFR